MKDKCPRTREIPSQGGTHIDRGRECPGSKKKPNQIKKRGLDSKRAVGGEKRGGGYLPCTDYLVKGELTGKFSDYYVVMAEYGCSTSQRLSRKKVPGGDGRKKKGKRQEIPVPSWENEEKGKQSSCLGDELFVPQGKLKGENNPSGKKKSSYTEGARATPQGKGPGPRGVI